MKCITRTAATCLVLFLVSILLPALDGHQQAYGAGKPGDSAIRNAVEDQIVLDLGTRLNNIDVRVTDGIVTLSGTVDNILEVAQTYRPYAYNPYLDEWNVSDYPWYSYNPGVPLKNDRAIEENIQDEFFWSPFVDSDRIDVKVEDGVAIITGTVDSWSDFYAAQKNAMDGGAVYVRNKLEVSSTSG